MTKSSGVERVFLGWHAPLLARAAEWILERHGDDLGDVLVALPGARAARTLRFELARRARPSWTPPSVLTQGALTDELVLSDRPVASRFARTLAWSSALSSLAPKRFAAITSPRPHDRDLSSWLALAEPVRALHAELAEEGIAFDDVARRAGGRADAVVDERLRARFEALAEAQALWRASLEVFGLADPHESRFAAIERGSIDPKRRVVLVGVADMNRLLARLVQRLGARATALVFAPREIEDAFDELGCLRIESWKDRELPIASERWHVVEGPGAQAERAIAIAASFEARFAAPEVVLGVADEEVAPYLERRLAEQGIRAIDARGTPASRTTPLTWLADLARYLEGRSFSALAALARHPDAEASLSRWKVLAGTDVATALDRCHRDHLPGRVEKGLSPDVDRVVTALETNLGELTGKARALSAWAEPIRAAIESTYGSRELDLALDEDRVLAEVLEHCAEAIGEIERTPPEIASHAVSASAAIESVLLALRSLAVAPRALAPGEPALDLVGWLDLALDPARAVIVTGFAEGRVPRAQGGSAFLTDALRRELGLPGRDARLARDVYAASVLVASCEEVHFVTGRETRARDPLLPSRLAFHVPDAELVERVKRFLPDAASPSERRPPPSASELAYALPRDPRPRAIDAMRVTAFRDYLESPYRFYLVHVLRLETLDDRARELDGRAFGIFAHAVLARFADEGPSASTDARAIEDFLRGAIDDRQRELFGASPRAVVRLQCAQLARRMGFFARWQAQRAARGWRIAHAEWDAPDAVALDLGDGSTMGVTGRIDRIDVHDESGAWALLDYKTGARARDPESAHKGRAGWRDLQLPLYTLLARSLALGGKRELGYVCIGREACEVGERMASNWTDAHVGEALDRAREVARDVRAGKFFELGRVVPSEPILAAIAGRGLLAPAIASAGEGGEG